MEIAQTADYALRALFTLEASDGQSTSELAEQLNLNRTTTQRILTTLHLRAAVLRDTSGRYWLGPLLSLVADGITEELATLGGPVVKCLARRTGETVILAKREGMESVIIARENERLNSLRVEYEIGYRQPLWLGATSLVLLAFSAVPFDEHLQQKINPRLLSKIRGDGFSITEGQVRPGMVGLAVPVLEDGRAVGSLGVVLPASRKDRVPSLLPVLREAGSDLGSKMPDRLVAKGGRDE